MIVYIDTDFKCYANPAENLTEVESDFFNGKCASLIECYRFIPEGSTWTREDGAVFSGEMISPYKDIRVAQFEQQAYENFMANINEYISAYNEGVESI